MNDKEQARFDAKVNKTDGCWFWTGCIIDTGYGQFYFNGKLQRAHRIAWSESHGPIPDDLQLDHLCRNRSCVNPAHLELVTNKTNVLRGVGVTAENARKTHCKRGHELSGGNLYMNEGYRYCLQCRREYRAWYANRNRKR